VALAVTSGAAAALIMSGTFEQIVAVAAVLFLLNYVSTYTALIVLRRREPRRRGPIGRSVIRTRRAWCWWAVWRCGSRRSWRISGRGIFAAVLLILCAPVYAWIARRRRLALAAVVLVGTAIMAAGTDAIYLAHAGIPTYGLSGMFVDSDLGNIHALDERIRVQSLYDGRDLPENRR
jgi:amino acid transporter